MWLLRHTKYPRLNSRDSGCSFSHKSIQSLQSSCILNPLFSEVETSPCTSAWEHLDSVTLSTMSWATINPPSDTSHLVPASKTKWNHTRFCMLEPPWTPLMQWITESEGGKAFKKGRRKKEALKEGLHVGKFCGKRASFDRSVKAILDQLWSCMCNVNMQISRYCKLKYGEFYEAEPLSWTGNKVEVMTILCLRLVAHIDPENSPSGVW